MKKIVSFQKKRNAQQNQADSVVPWPDPWVTGGGDVKPALSKRAGGSSHWGSLRVN